MNERPNILFLMSDEHRFDTSGFAGNTVVRTPTLDALAADAVQFDNAYTPSPICVPARQCIAAGQRPRTCGCERFFSDLPPFSMTFARRLAQFGYITSCHGKLHHRGPDQMQGWTDRGYGDMIVADWAFPQDPSEHVEGGPESGIGKWNNLKEIERARIGEHHQPDALATDSAVQFIRKYFADAVYDRPSGHRPLLLKLSLEQPHYPFICNHERFEYYLNRVEPYFNQSRMDHPILQRSQNMDEVVASERDIRRTTAAYYGMIEDVDEKFGRVLDTLRRVGQDPDDWVIVYTSDHGDMMGQHGVWEKTRFFEGSVRVPLLIRWPERFGRRRVIENVSLCDLFATLCDLTNTPLPEAEQTVNGAGLDSRSLVPLMRGETRAWHDEHFNESVSQFLPQQLMIKRGALKYQWYGDAGPEVLFDLEADPDETRNFIDEPRLADAVKTFRERRRELGHP